MKNEMIRLKFDEEHIQNEYLAAKIAISKLSEILFTLGTYTSLLRSDNSQERELGLKGIQHIVSLFDIEESPKTVEDAYKIVETLVHHIIADKLLNSVDNIVYIAVREANKGKAHTASIEGDLVDLIIGDDLSEEEIEKMLSLVEDTPVKKVEA